MNTHFVPRPEDHFIEQMGLIAQGDGAPRISGRLLGLLIVEGKPMSLQAIAERLSVSKASVSTNARLLAQREIIRLAAQPGARQDFYEFVPGGYPRMVAGIGESMRRTSQKIREAVKQFPEEASGARERVTELAEFYRVSADFIGEWAGRLDRR